MGASVLFHLRSLQSCFLMGTAGSGNRGGELCTVPGGKAGHTGPDAVGWWMTRGEGMRSWPKASAFSLL